MRFGLDVTQHQLEWDEILCRARFAEDAGFDGVVGVRPLQALYADPEGSRASRGGRSSPGSRARRRGSGSARWSPG